MTDILSILTLGVAFGASIKIADLCNEHGLRLFPGDALLFGALWGMLGSLLVMADPAIANVILAMVLAFIIQMRIDYFNHTVGTVMIIIAFLLVSSIEPKIFFIFFASFVFFGLLRAYIGEVRGKRDIIYWLSEPGWAHYYIVPLVWSLWSGMWLVFWYLAVYRTSYNVTKYGLYLKGAYTKL